MANKAILEKKQNVVSEIEDKIKSSSSVIFFDYRGLTDEKITELRKKLRETNSDMKVYKNTLTKRALDKLELSMDECVAGPSAIAFGNDVVLPIKIISEFKEENDLLNIKGGIIEGKVSTLEVLAKLAKIPPRDTLLTMIASGMLSKLRDLSISIKLYAESKNE